MIEATRTTTAATSAPTTGGGGSHMSHETTPARGSGGLLRDTVGLHRPEIRSGDLIDLIHCETGRYLLSDHAQGEGMSFSLRNHKGAYGWVLRSPPLSTPSLILQQEEAPLASRLQPPPEVPDAPSMAASREPLSTPQHQQQPQPPPLAPRCRSPSFLEREPAPALVHEAERVQEDSAGCIQGALRGREARRDAAMALMAQEDSMEQAAAGIQAGMRGREARHDASLAAESDADVMTMMVMREQSFRASRVIQGALRGKGSRSLQSQRRDDSYHESSRVIQSSIRARQGREERDSVRALDLAQREREAGQTLQAGMRGVQARHQVSDLQDASWLLEASEAASNSPSPCYYHIWTH